MRSEIFKILKGAVFCALFLLCGAVADEAKIKPMLLKEYVPGMNITGWVVSEKLDGVRAIWDGKNLRSRRGKIINAPEGWSAGFPPFFVDGELYTARGEFEQLVSIVSSSVPDERWSRVKFCAFDLPKEQKNLSAKMEILRNFIASSGAQNLLIVQQTPVSTHADVQAYFDRVIAAGGEGVVLRDPNALYESGRSDKILKYKKTHDSECKVVKINPGYGKNEGKMGSLSCVDLRSGAKFKVGTGFSDEMRANPPKVGTIITYQYQNLTREKKPRFPVFLRVRPAI